MFVAVEQKRGGLEQNFDVLLVINIRKGGDEVGMDEFGVDD